MMECVSIWETINLPVSSFMRGCFLADLGGGLREP